MINGIKGNTISEADAKKKGNELNEIKKVEIKGKRLIESQKKLLSLFDDLLKTIFNETVNENNSSTKNKTVNESNSSTKNESKSDHESDYESNNEGDLSNKDEKYKIKKLNDWFKTIDQTKSLEEQIELLKSKDFLYEYWSLKYYNDNKDLNYKIFKTKAAHLLIDLNKKIFEKVYCCNFTVLVEKLINTIDKKEENQIIVGNIKNNKIKFINNIILIKM